MSEVTDKPTQEAALWKQKYLECVDELETKQRADEVLRKAISRLTLAADGRDAQLDSQLEKVRHAIRDRAEVAELNRHIEALSKQLVKLDSRPANVTAEKPVVQEKLTVEKEVVAKSGFMQRLFKSDRAKTSSSAPIVEGISVEQALVDLLEHLDVPNSLEDRAMVLREQIKAGHIKDDWESLLDDITELINAMHCQMRDDQEDLENFLSEVSQRLQEVDAHIRGSAQSEDQGKDNRSEMDTAVRREVEEIGSSVRNAADIDQLRGSVESHLESVLGHMDEYQQSEETRYLENQQAMQDMSEQLKGMEKETKELRETVVREHAQAMTDVLTGIPNRLAYDQRFKQEVARCKRFDTSLVLMVWDVDLFKAVNDTYGHKAGDKVLKQLATALANGIRETDFIARYGGEEFVMLMTGSPIEACKQVADKLRANLEKIGFHFRGKSITVTASCGLSAYREEESPEQLFERADKALYKAKEQGRNQCVIG